MATTQFLDTQGLNTLWNRIKQFFVAKETGKGLSTNDYTTAEKNKLAGIAAGATANTGTVTGVQVNKNAVTSPDANGTVKLAGIPTRVEMNGGEKAIDENGVLDLGTVLTAHQSLANYAPKASPTFSGTPIAPTASAGTNTQQIATTAFVKTAVDNALGSITGIQFQVLNSTNNLPVTGEVGVIYLVKTSTTSGSDLYDEYIWVADTSKYELIGSTRVDLSNYAKYTDVIPDSTIEALA